MRRSIVPMLLVAICPLFMNVLCCKPNDQYPPGTPPCTGDELCTMQFAMVTTEVVDANGKAVKMDDAYTFTQSGNDTIRLQHNFPENGTYVVLDDSYLNNIKMKTISFIFKGVKDGKEVVSERFVISGDCCHINKQEGPATITIK